MREKKVVEQIKKVEETTNIICDGCGRENDHHRDSGMNIDWLEEDRDSDTGTKRSIVACWMIDDDDLWDAVEIHLCPACFRRTFKNIIEEEK